MSNSSFSEAQVVIDDYAALSSSVLWILDFIYMLPIEYDAIWSKKMSLHSVLFLVSRYGLSGQLGFNAFAGSYGASLSDTMCSIAYITGTVLGELSTTATLYLIALRVAAIHNQRKVALVVATALIVPYEVINIYLDSLVDSVSTKGTIYQVMVKCMITPNEDKVSLSSKGMLIPIARSIMTPTQLFS
ncbi:uncharacterized protein STEHIDRAFT_152491 [Stereum hirsutum FP-91666 SS1]|uniref:uncharacterized protein n=1 Tax=Stereum hirsutum (strain FP-91666) TaxID=721885 RepID=UPI000440AE50|nr:uncharacterized protein STEHIDRAFT_152491 [Stereum hirsutum FP-91666 SS1]EIM90795.1 hypothetical protein STEHIDRAFT_152491 [Stereum hirsutum FP-91666 SS1]